MFHVYIIKADDEGIYIGYTSNMKRRLEQHNAGEGGYTKGRQWKLVYCESYASKEDAMIREKRLKQHAKSLAMLKKRIEKSMQY